MGYLLISDAADATQQTARTPQRLTATSQATVHPESEQAGHFWSPGQSRGAKTICFPAPTGARAPPRECHQGTAPGPAQRVTSPRAVWRPTAGTKGPPHANSDFIKCARRRSRLEESEGNETDSPE